MKYVKITILALTFLALAQTQVFAETFQLQKNHSATSQCNDDGCLIDIT